VSAEFFSLFLLNDFDLTYITLHLVHVLWIRCRSLHVPLSLGSKYAYLSVLPGPDSGCCFVFGFNGTVSSFCRVKVKHGIKVVGAEAKNGSRWTINIEVNARKQSAMVTAYVMSKETYTKTDRWEQIVSCPPTPRMLMMLCAFNSTFVRQSPQLLHSQTPFQQTVTTNHCFCWVREKRAMIPEGHNVNNTYSWPCPFICLQLSLPFPFCKRPHSKYVVLISTWVGMSEVIRTLEYLLQW